MTMAAVASRDAAPTDRPHDPPRFSRRWFRRVAADFRRERMAFGLRSTVREFAWRARGYRGMLAYVEANNLSSLKSVYRLGYVTFGRVFILRILRRHLIFNSPGCKAFGFRVVAERRRARSRAWTWGAAVGRWMLAPLFAGSDGDSRGVGR